MALGGCYDEVGLGRIFLEFVCWKHEEEADLSLQKRPVIDLLPLSRKANLPRSFFLNTPTVKPTIPASAKSCLTHMELRWGGGRQTDIHGMGWGRWNWIEGCEDRYFYLTLLAALMGSDH